MERVPSSSRSVFEIPDDVANNFGTLSNYVNLLVQTSKEIGTGVDLCFTNGVARLGRIEASIATVPGKIQISNVRIAPKRPIFSSSYAFHKK